MLPNKKYNTHKWENRNNQLSGSILAFTCGQGQNLGVACEYPAGPRFWYNPSTRLCVSFTYRGCDGNSNNFLSQAECDRYCGSSGCPYGGLPQNVAGTTTRLLCSSTTPCAAGYDCLNVLISNTPFNVCCLSRSMQMLFFSPMQTLQ